MKNKKQIEALSEKACFVKFPEYDSVFENFTSRLRAVVGENVGGYKESGWFEYSNDNKAYCITIRTRGVIGDELVECQANFWLDPAKDLVEGLATLTKEVLAFEDACEASKQQYQVRQLVKEELAKKE